jgi:hypothetical protein
VAPIPRASVTVAMMVNEGRRLSERTASFNSRAAFIMIVSLASDSR